MRQVLSVKVEDRPGVLARIAGLFHRRGFNIESLTVGQSEQSGVSRMTIVVNEDEHVMEQIVKQLYKLVDVSKVMDLTSQPHVKRELVLVKVSINSKTRSEVLEIVDIFRGKIIDVSEKSLVVEMIGATDKIEGLINLLKNFGIIELKRTGAVSMLRG